MRYVERRKEVEVVFFHDFVKYGKEHSENVVDGIPWHFDYKGNAVSHENDDCYLITTIDDMLSFESDSVLLIGVNNKLSVIKKDVLDDLYQMILQ